LKKIYFTLLFLTLSIGQNHSLYFDGIGYARTDSVNVFTEEELRDGSLSCWFKTSHIADTYQYLVSIEAYVNIAIKDGMIYGCKDGACTWVSSNPLNLADGLWHNATIAWYGTNHHEEVGVGWIYLYIDGVLVNSRFSGVQPDVQNQNRPMVFGHHGSLSENYDIRFHGEIEDVVLWDNMLDDDQVYSYVNSWNMHPDENLLGYWKYNPDESDILYDYVGGNHASLNGASWIETSFYHGSSEETLSGNYLYFENEINNLDLDCNDISNFSYSMNNPVLEWNFFENGGISDCYPQTCPGNDCNSNYCSLRYERHGGLVDLLIVPESTDIPEILGLLTVQENGWLIGCSAYWNMPIVLIPEDYLEGCTDTEAYNYNSDATWDNASCVYAGCTDQFACNQDIIASIDDGSCEYSCHNNGDYSLDFDGNSDYVIVQDSDSLSPEDITVEMWIRQAGTGGAGQHYLNKSDGNEGYEYHLASYGNANNIVSGINIESGVPGNLTAPNAGIVFGEWFHLAFSYDSNIHRIFLNGVLIAEEERITDLQNTDGLLSIGSYLPYGNSTEPNSWAQPYQFEGKIREIRISNISRYSSDFPPQPFEFESDEYTVALWKFGKGTGDVLYDYSGNNNHGAIYYADWGYLSTVAGCTDPEAANYNPSATWNDSSCQYSGCTDELACNYDSGEIEDDGSCFYTDENYDCDGNCVAEIDCASECGGDAVVDECGICNGSGITDGACDCDGNVDSGCGCGEDGPSGCDETCGSTLEFDECGECNGNGPDENYDCDGNCIAEVDCLGECGGEAVVDVCGDCDGGITDNEICLSQISIDLHEGANLISFYIMPEDNSVDNVLSSLGDNATGIIGEGSAATNLPPWVGSLTTIECDKGYWLTVSEATELDIVGVQCGGANQLYSIYEGVNLISYPYEQSNTISVAIPDLFEGYFSAIIGEGTAAIQTSPGHWVGSLTELEPGKGYWFKSSANFIFAFDPPE